MKIWKRFGKWLGWGSLFALLAAFGANWYVVETTRSRVITVANDLSSAEVAVVLGAGRRLANGGENLYFKRRIEASAELWKSGKVKHFVLSGDHHRADYNEPADMRDALIAKGVPVGAMTLDFAGFRTLDTVVRAREVFGLKRCIFVTDDFHLSRTLYLAEHYGVEAIGFETKPLPWSISTKTRLREYFARVKAVLDVHVLRTQPKFLGEKIILPGAEVASSR